MSERSFFGHIVDILVGRGAKEDRPAGMESVGGAVSPGPARTSEPGRIRRRGAGYRPSAEARAAARRSPTPMTAPRGLESASRPALAAIGCWAYQLQKINVEQVAASPADIVVVDYSPDGDKDRPFTRAEVDRMKERPGGGRRKIVAYLSIGEAEEQRLYWDTAWIGRNGRKSRDAPKWLTARNDQGQGWDDNWKVEFWHPDWQRIIVDGPSSYLDRIIEAGFDGVYLDIIDGYEWWTERGRPSAFEEMVAFVGKIARHARETRGEGQFLIIPQNGEGLLSNGDYRATISAIGKEDIYFDYDKSADGNGVTRNSDSDIKDVLDNLKLAIDDNIPIIAVEYLRDRESDLELMPTVAGELREAGLIPFFGRRKLDQLDPPSLPPGV
jgi:cysteinyl-tRNA synthetase